MSSAIDETYQLLLLVIHQELEKLLENHPQEIKTIANRFIDFSRNVHAISIQRFSGYIESRLIDGIHESQPMTDYDFSSASRRDSFDNETPSRSVFPHGWPSPFDLQGAPEPAFVSDVHLVDTQSHLVASQQPSFHRTAGSQTEKRYSQTLEGFWCKIQRLWLGQNLFSEDQKVQLASIKDKLTSDLNDDLSALRVFRCYLAIANPQAMCDLRDILKAIRKIAPGFTRMRFNDVAQAIVTLEHIEATSVVRHVMRRFALLRICARRNEIAASMGTNYGGRVESEVLDILTRESFPASTTPTHDSFERRRKEISNQLQWGARWLAIQQCFSDGVVALICGTGVYAVANSTIERMTERETNVVISLLHDHRTDFLNRIGRLLSPYIANVLQGDDRVSRFRFEHCTDRCLLDQAFDSEELLDYCRLLGTDYV